MNEIKVMLYEYYRYFKHLPIFNKGNIYLSLDGFLLSYFLFLMVLKSGLIVGKTISISPLNLTLS